MAARIRLQRHGRRKQPYYFIVVMDSRASRDSKYIERLGSYDPNVEPPKMEVNIERAYKWLEAGAQPTPTVRSILSHNGVLYKKHLQRGVKKGALTQEEADKKLAEWLEAKSREKDAQLEKLKEQADKIEQERLEAERKINEQRAEELKKQSEEQAKEAVAEAEGEEEVGGEAGEEDHAEETTEQSQDQGSSEEEDKQ